MKKIAVFAGSFVLILAILTSFCLTSYAVKRQWSTYVSYCVTDRRDGVTPLAEGEFMFYYNKENASLRWMYAVTPVIDTCRDMNEGYLPVIRGSRLQRRTVCDIEMDAYRLDRSVSDYLALYGAFDLGYIGADRFIVSLAGSAVDKERVMTCRSTCARANNTGSSDELYPEKDKAYLFVITVRSAFKETFENVSRFAVVFGLNGDGAPIFIG